MKSYVDTCKHKITPLHFHNSSKFQIDLQGNSDQRVLTFVVSGAI